MQTPLITKAGLLAIFAQAYHKFYSVIDSIIVALFAVAGL